MNFPKLNALYEASESADYLPKIILWDLADYLIKLTALKQKLSSDYETVSSETEIEESQIELKKEMDEAFEEWEKSQKTE